MTQTPSWEILQGDALQIIPTFAPNTFDAVITEIKTQNLIQSTAA